MRRTPARNLISVAALAVTLLASWAFAQNAGPSERALFDAVNRERRAVGLPALRWDEALASAARQHASMMASQQSVQHTLPGEPSLPGRATHAGAHFSWISENIVQSTDARSAHIAFMNSPTHRANILDSDMDTVGIGIVERSGQIYVVEDFEKAK
jgi:uncharacterized protein YkwD